MQEGCVGSAVGLRQTDGTKTEFTRHVNAALLGLGQSNFLKTQKVNV
jgi:hypothetical protein